MTITHKVTIEDASHNRQNSLESYRYLNHPVNHTNIVRAGALFNELIQWFLPHAGENGYIRVKLHCSSTLHQLQGWCWVFYPPTHLLKLLQKTVAVCAQLRWPHFFFALRFRNEKCLFEQYLSGEKDIQSSRGFNQEWIWILFFALFSTREERYQNTFCVLQHQL